MRRPDACWAFSPSSASDLRRSTSHAEATMAKVPASAPVKSRCSRVLTAEPFRRDGMISIRISVREWTIRCSPGPFYNIYNNRAKLVNHGPMTIAIKRVYDPPAGKDGMRVLVDRLWPRGLTKERAAIDEWLRDLAPSDELRLWYHAHPEEWESFRKKYLK